MDDPLKKLADQSINGKPGAPRFDPGQLMYTEINNRYVTFYLRTHALAVMINDLTAEEASLAQLYYRDPARQRSNENDADDDIRPKTTDVSVSKKDSPITGNLDYRDSSTYDLPGDDPDKGLPDAIVYSPPWYIANFRIIFALVIICIVIGFLGVVSIDDYFNNIQFNKDKNEAIAIAMQDSSLQSFIAGKDVSIDSSAEYASPQSASKRQSMCVDIWVSVKSNEIDPRTNRPAILPSRVNRYMIYVDLENKKITTTDIIRVWP